MVQRPMFAPQGGKMGEDFDLNDLFADYLMTEVDDPMNPANLSMGAHPGATVAASLAQQQQHGALAQTAQAAVPAAAALPTGRGIKTAWHTGTMPVAPAPAQHFVEPMVKRYKVEDGQAAVNPLVAGIPAAAPAGSAISGRLGFSMVGGQVALPGQVAAAQKPQPEASKVPLPVGVGIRVGGAVGAVQPGGVQMTHTQWGGAVGQAQPGHPGATPGQFLMWGGMGGAAGVGGGVSEHAVAERRQRNREHAKRSRVRKKFMLESLQEQVRGLQKENEQLRMLIQKRIPRHAQKIINDVCSKNPLFSDEAEAQPSVPIPEGGEKKSSTELMKSDFSLIECLTSGQQNFVLSDPRLPDNPIVYASEGFYELTGYTREQVLGRNCRFLQGPGTDQKAVDVIRTAIANGTECTTCLLNYKADGTPFWNQFFVAALRDQDNCIVNYVGVQCEVEADAGATALEDKVNSVLPLQKKGDEEDDKDD